MNCEASFELKISSVGKQFICFMQNPQRYLSLPDFYQAKRDLFRAGLATIPFKLLPCEGSYFQCVDYSALPRKEAQLSEADFCRWLTTELGVAAIPNSAFYAKQTESGVVRFCFAKEEIGRAHV